MENWIVAQAESKGFQAGFCSRTPFERLGIKSQVEEEDTSAALCHLSGCGFESCAFSCQTGLLQPCLIEFMKPVGHDQQLVAMVTSKTCEKNNLAWGDSIVAPSSELY